MELQTYLLRKFTFIENQTFYENFILRKFGAILYLQLPVEICILMTYYQ